jgi:hypothetical protein
MERARRVANMFFYGPNWKGSKLSHWSTGIEYEKEEGTNCHTIVAEWNNEAQITTNTLK